MEFCPHCMRPATGEICENCGENINWKAGPSQLAVGTLLRGTQGRTYQTGAVKGQGGFGITYAAMNLMTTERIAIKEYFPQHCATRSQLGAVVPAPGQLEAYKKSMNAFIDEAKVLSAVGVLPSVVSVLDYFEANGTAYLVMEYVEGIPLSKSGKIPSSVLFPLLNDFLTDLETLHRAGVIHRDISPDNIIRTPDGKLKLLDFGSARSLHESNMTVLLKPGFSPIEQYQSKGQGQGPYTDVYALAATIYYCLTGVTPPSSIDRIYGDDPLKPPTELGADITATQEQAILSGLIVHPAQRTPSVDLFQKMMFSDYVPEPVTTYEGLRAMTEETAIPASVKNPTTKKEEEAASKAKAEPEKKAENKTEQKQKPREKGGKKALILTIAIILIVAAAAVILYAATRGTPADTTAPQQTTTAPQQTTTAPQQTTTAPQQTTTAPQQTTTAPQQTTTAPQQTTTAPQQTTTAPKQTTTAPQQTTTAPQQTTTTPQQTTTAPQQTTTTPQQTTTAPKQTTTAPKQTTTAPQQTTTAPQQTTTAPQQTTTAPQQTTTAPAIPSSGNGFKIDKNGVLTDYTGSATSVTIPNGVTSIGNWAFRGCSSLTSINIPDSVTSICDLAFEGCKGLTSIEIPSGVTSIGRYAFMECTGLTSIKVEAGNTKYHSQGNCLIETNSKTLALGCKNSVIPFDGSVTSIGDYAFYGCTGLTSIEIPSSVTSIGNSAFYGCTGLASIEITSGVTSIGSRAFDGCTGLTSIKAEAGNTKYHSQGNCLIETNSKTLALGCKNSVIPFDGSVTSIGDYAFGSCDSLTSINIPDGVTSIGEHAFWACSSLTSINIPDSVTSIDGYAFCWCSSLTSINIPDGVTSIGEHAFWTCSSLTSVTIGNGVTSIGNGVFDNCDSLTSITIPDSVTSIGENTFVSCDSLTSVTFENTSGWYAGNTSVSVTNPAQNATYLTSTYRSYAWKRH